MADKNGTKVTITAGDQDVRFVVTLDDYHRYQNEMMPDNKIAPSKNFLSRTVASECKDQLDQLISQGFTLDLAAMVGSEFRPAMELSIKK